RQAVDVGQERVAVPDLKHLTNACADDAWTVDAPMLVDGYRRARHRRLRKRALETDEDIHQAAIRGRNDGFLDDPLPRVDLGAHGVLAHPDDRIAGQFSHEPDVAFDRAAPGRL